MEVVVDTVIICRRLSESAAGPCIQVKSVKMTNVIKSTYIYEYEQRASP